MFIWKQKINLIPQFFSYYALQNAGIWLAKNILGNNSRARILPDFKNLARWKVKNQKTFHSALFFEKTRNALGTEFYCFFALFKISLLQNLVIYVLEPYLGPLYASDYYYNDLLSMLKVGKGLPTYLVFHIKHI